MAAQGGSSALKNDTWSILLPVIAALVGAIVGAAGSTAATYLTLRENRATEQRKLQADAYVKFIDLANRTHDQLELYEDCTDQCESHEAELLKVEETLDPALDRVFIYGSYSTYVVANDIVGNLYNRRAARQRGEADSKLADAYKGLEDKYLRSTCGEVNAVRQTC